MANAIAMRLKVGPPITSFTASSNSSPSSPAGAARQKCQVISRQGRLVLTPLCNYPLFAYPAVQFIYLLALRVFPLEGVFS